MFILEVLSGKRRLYQVELWVLQNVVTQVSYYFPSTCNEAIHTSWQPLHFLHHFLERWLLWPLPYPWCLNKVFEKHKCIQNKNLWIALKMYQYTYTFFKGKGLWVDEDTEAKYVQTRCKVRWQHEKLVPLYYLVPQKKLYQQINSHKKFLLLSLWLCPHNLSHTHWWRNEKKKPYMSKN